ncbi:hypothetical protein ROZALSC1DRAFT_26818 [Rozella allomycis CSF55]|uniref:PCI domain-containing protein n=1 Tax=Rozella allomycis (strain CSF55) TaxID=988480 RepID=A0A4P9YQ61_ROZAC|nr:hypothetical protein ROZALSC1DRAFT_26818 [Rozella allomycis CSF55]
MENMGFTTSPSLFTPAATQNDGFVPITDPKTVPAFLNKLYNMVSDSSSSHLIRWSDSGNSFIVTKPDDFSREVLPRFFKHGNFTSFVRQLNMYGFHKVPHLQQGVLIAGDNTPDYWEFANDLFKKNKPELLCFLKRKTGKESSDEKESMDVKMLLNELSTIKQQQLNITEELKNLQRDNQLLWSESIAARERHMKQEEMINKIVRFLGQMFANDRSSSILPKSKKRHLMIQANDLLNTNKNIPQSSSDKVMELPEDKISNMDFKISQTKNDIQGINEDIDILETNLQDLTDSLGLNEDCKFDENFLDGGFLTLVRTSNLQSMGDVKMERDFSVETDATISLCDKKLLAGNPSEALESLFSLEKQTRLAGDAFSTGKLLVKIITVNQQLSDWKAVNDNLLLLSKKRGQLKQAITVMVQKAVSMVDQTPNMSIKLDLINTLRSVTEGKIFVEVERARLTKMLSGLKEQEGNLKEATEILHELQIETFGSMDKREKVDFILEQMRLGLAIKDFVETQVISKKISSKFLQEDENEDLKLRFYHLMIQIGLHDNSYLDICKYYQQIYQCKSIKEDSMKYTDTLRHVSMFVALAPFSNEQVDLLHHIYLDKNLNNLPIYKELLKCLSTTELLRWVVVQDAFAQEKQTLAAFSGVEGQKRWNDLKDRIVEHNIRVINSHYECISFKRFVQLLELNADEAEEAFSKMVVAKTIQAKMDRPLGIINFRLARKKEEVLNEWSTKLKLTT